MIRNRNIYRTALVFKVLRRISSSLIIFFPSLEKISRKIFRGLSANIEGRNVCTLYGSSIIARFLFFWNFCTRQNCTRDENTFPFTVQPSGDFWILYCQTLWNSLNCPRQWHGYARNPRNTRKENYMTNVVYSSSNTSHREISKYFTVTMWKCLNFPRQWHHVLTITPHFPVQTLANARHLDIFLFFSLTIVWIFYSIFAK